MSSFRMLLKSALLSTFLGVLGNATALFAQCPADAGTDQDICEASPGSQIILALQGNDPGVGNTGLWTVISGPGGHIFSDATDPNSTFTAPKNSTWTLRWTITQADTTECSDDVVLNLYEPTTSDAGPDQTGAVDGVCGSSTTIMGNDPAGGSGEWTIVAGDGNGFFGAAAPRGGGPTTSTNPTETFNGTPGQTYTLQWATSNPSCPPVTDTLDIEFFAPVTPNAGADQNVCGTTTFLGAVLSTGTGMWSITSGAGGVLGDASNPASSFDGNFGVTYTLTWTETNGPCSDSDTVNITFFDNPTVAAAGVDQDVCADNTTLAANAAGGFMETGTWSVVIGAGGSFGDANSPTSSFTGTRGVTYTLRWTISNGVCPISTDDVQVDLREDVTANAGADQSVCGTTTFLGASLSTGTDGSWSIISGVGGTIDTPTSPTSGFSGTVGTTYTLQWMENNGPCNDTDTVDITFFDNPTVAAAGVDQDVCADNTTLAANAAAGFMETGTWSVVMGVGGSFGDANSPTSSFTGTRGVTYILRWTISNGVCPISTDDVQVDLREDVTANAGADQNVCGTSTTLAASLSTGTDGSWSIISGVGGTIDTPTSPTSGFNGTVGTTYTLQWMENNGPCNDTDTVDIRFFDNPSANAGPDQTGMANGVCGTMATLAANAPGTDETGTWSVISGDGNGSFGDVNSETSSFSGTTGQTYTLRWTLTNGVCPDSSDDVDVEFFAEPTTAFAGDDYVVCFGPVTKGGGVIVRLQGNDPGAGETGMWTVESSTPPAAAFSFDDPTIAKPFFTGDENATYTVRWTITPVAGSPCPASTDEATVTFPANPPTATAMNQTVCSDTVTLDGSDPGTNTGTWTIEMGDGNGYFGGVPGTLTSNTFNDMFTGTRGTSYTLKWLIASGNLCPDSETEITISLVDDPTPANAGPDQTGVSGVCGVNATLAGNAPTVGTGMWTITGVADGMGVLTDPSDPTTTFSGTPGQTYTLTWTTSNTPCTDSTDTVDIEFFDTEVALAGPDQNLCTNPMRFTDSTGSGDVPILDNDTTTDMINIADPGAGTYPNAATITRTSVFLRIEHTDFRQLNVSLQSPMGTTVNLLDGSNGCHPLQNFINVGFDDLSTRPFCNGLVGPADLTMTLVMPEEALSAFNGQTFTGNWTLTVIDNAVGETGIFDWDLVFETNSTTMTTLAANTPSLGTGMWSVTSGDGNGVFGDASSPTSTFTGTVGQRYTLQWEITGSDPCPLTNDTVIINFLNDDEAFLEGFSLPPAACEGTDFVQLDAFEPPAAEGTGTWSILAGDGNGFFDDTPGQVTSNLANATFHGTRGQSYEILWTVNNACFVPKGGTNTAGTIVSFPNNPSTANAGPNVARCVIGVTTATATLNAEAPAIGGGFWSIASVTPSTNLGGEIFSDIESPTSQFTGNVGSVYVLEWTTIPAIFPTPDGFVCTSSDQMEVILKELPAANAGPDQVNCSNDTTLTGNAPTPPVVGTWSIVSGDGNGSITDPNNPNSEFTGNRNVAYTLRWTLADDICTTFDDVVITFIEDPIATASNQDVCDTTATLDGGHNGTPGELPLLATGQWTIVDTVPAGNMNGQFGAGGTTSTNPTDTFTGDAGVTYNLQWTINNPPCFSDNIQVAIEFVQPPDDPNAGADQTECSFGAKLEEVFDPAAAIPDDGTDFVDTLEISRWMPGNIFDVNVFIDYAHENADELTFTLTHIESTTSIPLITGLTCGNQDAGLRILDDQAPNALGCGTGWFRPVGLVPKSAADLSTFNGIELTGTWQLTVSDGSPGGNTGTINRWGLIINEGTVNLAGLPDPLSEPSMMGSWGFADGGEGDGLGFFADVPGQQSTAPANSGFTTTFTGTPGVTYTLAFTTENSSCPEKEDTVTITFDEAPTLATVGPDQMVCSDTTTLTGNEPVVGQGTWFVINVAPNDPGLPPDPGGESFADVNLFNTSFTGNRGYTYTLGWGIDNGTCLGTVLKRCKGDCDNIEELQVRLDLDPTPAQAGPDQTVCDTLTTTLAGNAPAVGTGQGTWSFVGPGNIVFGGPDKTASSNKLPGSNDPNTQITADTLGEYTLTWTQSNGVCTDSTDDVVITFGVSPTTANAGADQTGANAVCDGEANLAANVVGGGETGTWSVTLGDGNGAFGDVNSPTTTFTGTAGVTYTLQWSIGNGVCPDSSDTLDVLIQPILDAQAGDDQLVCDLDPAVLAAVLSNGTGGTWSVITGDGNGMFTDVNDPTTTFTGTTGVTYTLQWEETDGVACTDTDTVDITFFATPMVDAGDDFGICIADTITLGASDPTVGTGTWTVQSGPAGADTNFADANDPTTTFTTDLAGEYVLEWEVVSGSCVIADTVTLDIDEFRVEVPANQAQGLSTIQLEATPFCTSKNSTIQWRDITNGSDFPVDQNPISLSPAPTENTEYRVTVTDNDTTGTVQATVLILVGDDTDFLDLNGDGCNDATDLFVITENWRELVTDDANGDGIIDVLDFMYIRTGEVCP
ncbi:Proprotein convertase P-domain-containing protein [Sulfidibacter corallicola]|uniref:Proprotein convertase P-domain-containing protein n=1 Tax=Sulfidibacter corallicola TaxID=2818388 RepID=A0A8A4TNR5_SULCO|nr:proprotein convertase P-domain-containing protein [Sulfidibacter corallicola]QTD51619.1 proprotein convertase P-domain-containing protein [Sulfidibacter corallicola]